MGDFNQFLWIKKHASLIKGPILEVGAKFYNPKTSMNYRSLAGSERYVGIDMEEGPNVDAVIDFTKDFREIESQIGSNFQTVICCSVMEHVRDIYAFSANITKILKPGGVLFLSVPFTWEHHGYPDDYWRFTPSAIKFLYPEFEFLEDGASISSSIDGDAMDLKQPDDINDFLLKNRVIHEYEANGRGVARIIKKSVALLTQRAYRREFILRKILGREYRLSLSCINMIGIKK